MIDFEQHRGHVRGVAYRMLGSLAEADDAVQEAWLRLDRAAPGAVATPRGVRLPSRIKEKTND